MCSPDLNPAHDEGEFARYSEFYDLDYFSTQSQVAMAEWRDVMTTNSSSSTEKGELACWGHSTWSNNPLALYNTQTWFWPFPEQLQSKYFVETSITFAGIDVLNSGDNTEWLMSKVKSWFGSIEKSPPLPDRHLLCFQNLFYASTVKFVEGQVDQSVDIEELRRDGPVWNNVGQFLRFTPRIDHIVDEMLEALIGDASQPFIAIHLRQGDVLNSGDNTEWLMSKVKSWFGSIEKSPPLPDRHLLCFQNLFYASTVKFVEGQVDQSVDIEELRRDGPVWNTVGQFLRFTPRIDHIVDEMLETLIGDSSQPFIAIHLRQGDFLTLGRTSNETSSIKDTYSKGLNQLHTILATLPILDGFDITRLPVLLATDSTDPNLLANLSSLGWKLIDHGKLETRKKYGGWYPGVLDSAILSRAVGLVG